MLKRLSISNVLHLKKVQLLLNKDFTFWFSCSPSLEPLPGGGLFRRTRSSEWGELRLSHHFQMFSSARRSHLFLWAFVLKRKTPPTLNPIPGHLSQPLSLYVIYQYSLMGGRIMPRLYSVEPQDSFKKKKKKTWSVVMDIMLSHLFFPLWGFLTFLFFLLFRLIYEKKSRGALKGATVDCNIAVSWLSHV